LEIKYLAFFSKTALFFFTLIISINLLSAYNADTLKVKKHKEQSIDLSAAFTQMNLENFWGFNVDWKFFPYERLGTGLYFTWAMNGTHTKDTFNYHITKPEMDLFEIGWINQYVFIKDSSFRLNLNLVNGWADIMLSDRGQQERYKTRYGYSYRAKSIDNNSYYLLEPGLDFLIKTVKRLWISAKIDYRFLFGSTHFARKEDFSKFIFFVGITGIW
jgi:hypothetical protein